MAVLRFLQLRRRLRILCDRRLRLFLGGAELDLRGGKSRIRFLIGGCACLLHLILGFLQTLLRVLHLTVDLLQLLLCLRLLLTRILQAESRLADAICRPLLRIPDFRSGILVRLREFFLHHAVGLRKLLCCFLVRSREPLLRFLLCGAALLSSIVSRSRKPRRSLRLRHRHARFDLGIRILYLCCRIGLRFGFQYSSLPCGGIEHSTDLCIRFCLLLRNLLIRCALPAADLCVRVRLLLQNFLVSRAALRPDLFLCGILLCPDLFIRCRKFFIGLLPGFRQKSIRSAAGFCLRGSALFLSLLGGSLQTGFCFLPGCFLFLCRFPVRSLAGLLRIGIGIVSCLLCVLIRLCLLLRQIFIPIRLLLRGILIGATLCLLRVLIRRALCKLRCLSCFLKLL